MVKKPKLTDIFLLFLKIGAIGFGGGLAMIGILREYLVNKQIIDDDDFGRGLCLGQLLPGPFVTNFVEYYGYHLKKWIGSLIAVVGLLIPSFVIVLVLSIFYFKYQDLPLVKTSLSAILPIVTGILIVTCFGMAKSYITKFIDVIFLLLSVLLLLLNVDMAFVIIAAGIIRVIIEKFKNVPQPLAVNFILLFLVFAKIGALTFGGGYGALPIMENEVVTKFQWLTLKEFTDAVAIGQLTPGPIAITAVVVGYRVGGVFGSLLATIAIFLPSYLMLIVACRIFKKYGDRPLINAFFAGARPAIVAVIIILIIKLTSGMLGNILNFPLLAAAVMLYFLKVPIPVLVLIGLGFGFILPIA